MMNTRFVGNDEIAAMAVMENSADSGVSAVEYADDAAFSANGRSGRLASPSVAPLDACDNAVSVHGVSKLIGRNEKVAIQGRSRRIWNHKAVPIPMCDETPLEQIGIARCGLRKRSGPSIRFCGIRFRGGTQLGSLARQTIVPASYFVDEASALQLR